MKKTFWLALLPVTCGTGIFLIAHAVGHNALPERPAVVAANHATALQSATSLRSPTDRAIARPLNSPPLQTTTWRKHWLVAGSFSAPVVFEPNLSQAPVDAQFVARGAKMSFALTGAGIAVDVPSKEDPNRRSSEIKIHVRDRATLVWHGKAQALGETNYFLGNDPRTWCTHVAHFGRVKTTNGQTVGLAIYGNGQRQNEGSERHEISSSSPSPACLSLCFAPEK